MSILLRKSAKSPGNCGNIIIQTTQISSTPRNKPARDETRNQLLAGLPQYVAMTLVETMMMMSGGALMSGADDDEWSALINGVQMMMSGA